MMKMRSMSINQKVVLPECLEEDQETVDIDFSTFEGQRTEMNMNWKNHRTDNAIQPGDVWILLHSVFRWNVCLTIFLGCIAVYGCGKLKIRWDADLSVAQFGILFPMVFVLTQAYNRREAALVAMSEFKSSIFSLYWIHRDWALADDDTPLDQKFRHVENTYRTLSELVCNCRCFLQSSHLDPPHHIDYYLDQVYKCISQLTVLGRQAFLDDCINEASLFRYEVMRQKLVESFEKVRVLRDYRTPRTLMFMTTFLLYVGCFVLAPYFNSYCAEGADAACSAAYFMATAYALVLFNIHNVVGDLESSYDHVGVDDIHFSIRQHLSRLHHGIPAAFYKHNKEGYYIIQEPNRFKLRDGVLRLDEAELDLYPEMCLKSQYLSHEEMFDQGLKNVTSKIKKAEETAREHVNLRTFSRRIFSEQNIMEVNKFSRRTHKQEMLSEEEVEKRNYSRRRRRSELCDIQEFDD